MQQLVNGRMKSGIQNTETCGAHCSALAECTGYAFVSAGWYHGECAVYGERLDEGLAKWEAFGMALENWVGFTVQENHVVGAVVMPDPTTDCYIRSQDGPPRTASPASRPPSFGPSGAPTYCAGCESVQFSYVGRGFCRGPQPYDLLCGRAKSGIRTELDCQNHCAEIGHCVGFAYVSEGIAAGECAIYGKGLDMGLETWEAFGKALKQWVGFPAPHHVIGNGVNPDPSSKCYKRGASFPNPPPPTPSPTPTEHPTTRPPSPSPSHTPTEPPTRHPTRYPTFAPTRPPTRPPPDLTRHLSHGGRCDDLIGTDPIHFQGKPACDPFAAKLNAIINAAVPNAAATWRCSEVGSNADGWSFLSFGKQVDQTNMATWWASRGQAASDVHIFTQATGIIYFDCRSGKIDRLNSFLGTSTPPTPAPTPPPTTKPNQNHYYIYPFSQQGWQGGWGGKCLCPDGKEYIVADIDPRYMRCSHPITYYGNNARTRTIACCGGTVSMGRTRRYAVDHGRKGYQVDCAGSVTMDPDSAE